MSLHGANRTANATVSMVNGTLCLCMDTSLHRSPFTLLHAFGVENLNSTQRRAADLRAALASSSTTTSPHSPEELADLWTQGPHGNVQKAFRRPVFTPVLHVALPCGTRLPLQPTVERNPIDALRRLATTGELVAATERAERGSDAAVDVVYPSSTFWSSIHPGKASQGGPLCNTPLSRQAPGIFAEVAYHVTNCRSTYATRTSGFFAACYRIVALSDDGESPTHIPFVRRTNSTDVLQLDDTGMRLNVSEVLETVSLGYIPACSSIATPGLEHELHRARKTSRAFSATLRADAVAYEQKVRLLQSCKCDADPSAPTFGDLSSRLPVEPGEELTSLAPTSTSSVPPVAPVIVDLAEPRAMRILYSLEGSTIARVTALTKSAEYYNDESLVEELARSRVDEASRESLVSATTQAGEAKRYDDLAREFRNLQATSSLCDPSANLERLPHCIDHSLPLMSRFRVLGIISKAVVACYETGDVVCNVIARSGGWEAELTAVLFNALGALRHDIKSARKQLERAAAAKNISGISVDSFDDPSYSRRNQNWPNMWRDDGVEFIDIGANVGSFSFYLWKMGFPVRSFDALPFNVQLMRMSKCLNRFQQQREWDVNPSRKSAEFVNVTTPHYGEVQVIHAALASEDRPSSRCGMFSEPKNFGDVFVTCNETEASNTTLQGTYIRRGLISVRSLDGMLFSSNTSAVNFTKTDGKANSTSDTEISFDHFSPLQRLVHPALLSPLTAASREPQLVESNSLPVEEKHQQRLLAEAASDAAERIRLEQLRMLRKRMLGDETNDTDVTEDDDDEASSSQDDDNEATPNVRSNETADDDVAIDDANDYSNPNLFETITVQVPTNALSDSVRRFCGVFDRSPAANETTTVNSTNATSRRTLLEAGHQSQDSDVFFAQSEDTVEGAKNRRDAAMRLKGFSAASRYGRPSIDEAAMAADTSVSRPPVLSRAPIDQSRILVAKSVTDAAVRSLRMRRQQHQRLASFLIARNDYKFPPSPLRADRVVAGRYIRTGELQRKTVTVLLVRRRAPPRERSLAALQRLLKFKQYVVKIDVEGHEIEILKGCPKFLTKDLETHDRPKFIMSEVWRKVNLTAYAELMLGRFGYIAYSLSRQMWMLDVQAVTWYWHQIPDSNQMDTLIFVDPEYTHLLLHQGRVVSSASLRQAAIEVLEYEAARAATPSPMPLR